MTEKKEIIALRDLSRYSRERNFAYNNGLYFDFNKELEYEVQDGWKGISVQWWSDIP